MKRARRSCLTSSGTASGSVVRGGALDRRIGEAADAVELRFLAGTASSSSNSASVSPGKPTMKVRADGDVGADLAPGADALERLLGVRRALHQLEDARARVLERHVEVGKDLALGHQRNDFVDVRIRIDVVQPHPHAELARARGTAPSSASSPACRRQKPVRYFTSTPYALVSCEMTSSSFTPAFTRFSASCMHFADRARHQIAAHRGNDAEGAAVVAAFGDLQIGVVLRRELDALRRNQVGVRIVRLRQVRVHRLHHRRRVVRAGDREHRRDARS